MRDQRIGVLTTSPMSMHQAELLRQWSDRVTVFTAGLGPMEEAARRRLESRGVVLVDEPVTAVLGDAPAITAVRTADGAEHAIDAVFTGPDAVPHDGPVASLGLDRSDTPFGSVLTVGPDGRTSHERIWAVGNVVLPPANVPMSIGAGAMTGGAVNAALVGWDFDAAGR
ncbi:MAG: hypothetical protein QM774_09950 [Gordonia sp. (in: high G+C Gram-positive bacteria)]|uniref:hypothetical protein n=1 Tax=Gordonia sp. (in: high G+C Gram-positive bacteria) TaxID=84139 RepID=UPI0039E46132